jgi:hypothetical protein
VIQDNLGKNKKLYLKNNDSKNGWRCGLSGKEPTTKNKALNSKTNTTKKKKKKTSMKQPHFLQFFTLLVSSTSHSN